jgi:hypothetical protein
MAEILDAVERGETIVVERRGTRFRLSAERAHETRRRRTPQPLFEIVDPAVEAGQWTWAWSPGRMTFKSRLKKR